MSTPVTTIDTRFGGFGRAADGVERHRAPARGRGTVLAQHHRARRRAARHPPRRAVVRRRVLVLHGSRRAEGTQPAARDAGGGDDGCQHVGRRHRRGGRGKRQADHRLRATSGDRRRLPREVRGSGGASRWSTEDSAPTSSPPGSSGSTRARCSCSRSIRTGRPRTGCAEQLPASQRTGPDSTATVAVCRAPVLLRQPISTVSPGRRVIRRVSRSPCEATGGCRRTR